MSTQDLIASSPGIPTFAKVAAEKGDANVRIGPLVKVIQPLKGQSCAPAVDLPEPGGDTGGTIPAFAFPSQRAHSANV